MDRSCNTKQWTPSKLGRSTNIGLNTDRFTEAIKGQDILRITHASDADVSETLVDFFRRNTLGPMVVQDHIKATFSGPELNEFSRTQVLRRRPSLLLFRVSVDLRILVRLVDFQATVET